MTTIAMPAFAPEERVEVEWEGRGVAVAVAVAITDVTVVGTAERGKSMLG